MYSKTTLDSGLRIITSPMPHTHSVCIAVFAGVGSRYENDSEAGISHFIEHILFRGTAAYPTARHISEAIEGIGGVLNGATDKELTFFWCKVTEEHFHQAAAVLTDMVLNSKFDPVDIERERQVIIEEINMCKDSPSQQASLLIDEILWPDHPLGRDIAGTRDSMANMNRTDLKTFLHSKYSPENILISVTGNINQQEVIDTINSLTQNFNTPSSRNQYCPFVEKKCDRLRVINRDTEQINFCLALPGIGLMHPKRFHLDLMNVILGEGMSSRLFSEVRDRLGLAYSINSFVEHFLDTGALTVSASFDPHNLEKTAATIIELLESLKDPIPEKELNKAREISKGRLLLRMEDSRNVAGWLGGQEILTDNILMLEDVIRIIDDITAEQVQQIARDLINPEKTKIAIVGPVKDTSSVEQMIRI